MNILDKFLSVDRRWIFLLVLIATLLPFLFPLNLPIRVSPPVENAFNTIEAIEPDEALLLSFDYDPSTQPELSPMATAILCQCFDNEIPVVITCLHPGGPGLMIEVTRTVAEEKGAVEGEDFVILGYKVGSSAVILSIGEDIRLSYPADYNGVPIDEYPMMKDIKNYNDFGAVVTLSGSTFPEAWVAYAHERYGATIISGVTAVMAADYYPFLQTGQMSGLLGGLKGAAEYEILVGKPDKAVSGMDAQTIIHMFIVFIVILGNIAYFIALRMKRKEQLEA